MRFAEAGTDLPDGKGDSDATERARLLAALSYECYLTDQLSEAYTARLAALEEFQRTGEPAAVGTPLRWLSQLS